nr:transposase [Acinetobacter sp. GSS19]
MAVQISELTVRFYGGYTFQWFLPQWIQQYGEEHILYINESGINTNETAEYGWSKKGKRCHALKSGGHGSRLSMISAVRSSAAFRFIAPFIFQGSCDRSTFSGWLEYLLKDLPKDKSGLHQKHLLILDNASIQKVKKFTSWLFNTMPDSCIYRLIVQI